MTNGKPVALWAVPRHLAVGHLGEVVAALAVPSGEDVTLGGALQDALVGWPVKAPDKT